jgi:WD40 repeat protein
MKNTTKLLTASALSIIAIFAACKTSETDRKSQVSESGEPRLVVQLGHSGGISSAVYSPDGKYIVSGGIDDKVAILWEASTGREIRRFIGHTNQINSVAFSPDGKFVLTGSGNDYLEEKDERDFSVRLWDIFNGKEVKRFEGHTDKVNSVVFSPDGKLILTGSKDKTARLWNLENRKEIQKIGETKTPVYAVSYSRDGSNILIGTGELNNIGLNPTNECVECSAKLLDTKTGKIIRTFTKHTQPVGSLAFSPNGQSIITASATPDWDLELRDNEGKIFQWEISTGKIIREYEGFGPVSFSPNSKFVITSGNGDKKSGSQIWNALTGEKLKYISGPKYRAEEGTNKMKEYGVVQVAVFSPNNSFVLIGFDTTKNSGNMGGEFGEKMLKTFQIESGNQMVHFNSILTSEFLFEKSSMNGQVLETRNNLWNIENSSQTNFSFLKHKKEDVNEFQGLSRDGKLVAIADNGEIIIVETSTGNLVSKFKAYSYEVWFTPNNKYLCVKGLDENTDGVLQLFEIKAGKLIWEHSLGMDSRWVQSFRQHRNNYAILSTDGNFVIALLPKYPNNSENDELIVIKTETGEIINRIQTPQLDSVPSIAISPNSRFVSFDSYDGSLNIYDMTSNKISLQIKKDDFEYRRSSFSPDSKFTAIQANKAEGGPEGIQLWDLTTNKLLYQIPHGGPLGDILFSPNGKYLLTTAGSYNGKLKDDNIAYLWDTSSGKMLKKFEHQDIITSSSFSENGNVILTESSDNTTKLWDTLTGKEICQLVSSENGDWIVTTPDGRFDTNNLDKVEGMHWIMPSEPLRPLPIEIFMRQYYEPKLLARVLKCNEEKNCEREFKPLPALHTLNRTQPEVKIVGIKPDADNTVEVTVEVANTKSEGQKDTLGNPLESGVNDVRLFRDGQLVGYAPKTNQTEQSTWEWLKSFVVKSSESTGGKVELNNEGKATLKFSKIKLPKTGIDKVEFSAYAFNVDQIKSETSRQTYEFKASNVKGRAYIISMGVNANEKQGSDLRFAANDARQMQENLTKRLLEQGQYEEVVNIPLISDFTVAVNGNAVQAKDATVDQIKTGQKTVTENTATKEHFKAVLDVLAGRQTNAEMLKTIQNADKLSQANPEDLIIISVSSHGFADKHGVFYLLTSDGKTVSSDELSLWLRDVDGGEMTLVIDACRSASAVETADFKPAPMNARGLGQLSYDKGMRILTATQADNVALETNQTRQGLLSYALLQNGLNDFQADFKPQDRTIVMSEWLNFGVERVPRLYEEANSGQTKIVRETNDTAESETQQRQEKTQRPSLFDFSRKNRDVTIEKRAGSVPNKIVETTPTITPTPMPVSSPKPIPEGFNGRVIKYDTVIVRALDSTSSAEVGKVYRNDPIKIGAQKGEWFRVTTISGVEGWMHGNSLEFVK